MWCWRRMEKISWTDRVRNEEVLHRVKEERNIVHTIKRRKVNWVGHILRRNCLLKHVIEGKLEGRIEMTERRERRRKQLLDDLKESSGYLQLKEKTLVGTLWRTRFGRSRGLLIHSSHVTVYRHILQDLHLLHLSISSDAEKWARNVVHTSVNQKVSLHYPKTKDKIILIASLLPNHGRCRGLLLHMITLCDTHTHTRRIPWTRDRPLAKVSTRVKHNIHKRQTFMARRVTNPQSQQASGHRSTP
jgi:hypothetical protein